MAHAIHDITEAVVADTALPSSFFLASAIDWRYVNMAPDSNIIALLLLSSVRQGICPKGCGFFDRSLAIDRGMFNSAAAQFTSGEREPRDP